MKAVSRVRVLRMVMVMTITRVTFAGSGFFYPPPQYDGVHLKESDGFLDVYLETSEVSTLRLLHFKEIEAGKTASVARASEVAVIQDVQI